MNCRRCGDCEFVIRTNPQGRCFDYLSGIKKKQEEFDTIEAGSLGVIDTDVGNGILPSAVVRSNGSLNVDANEDIAIMERQNAGVRNANNQIDHLKQVYKFQREHMLDDAASNSKLRATFRVDRKAKKKRQLGASALGLGRGIELSDAINDDKKVAKGAFDESFQIQHLKVVKREKKTLQRVRTESIFSNQRTIKVRRGRNINRSGAEGIAVKVEGKTSNSERKNDYSAPSSTTMPDVITSNTEVHDKMKLRSKNEIFEDYPSANDSLEGVSALSALADYDSD